ncbi:hypothetical protein VTK73DRAFT_4677 [Phialemonium thermophilum]|uniref:Uncharacterized protein n=1 Tax=Phialemonium thermophilum TaxID=223376 RepID=A0ABR3V6U9_9PEZI
MGRIRRRAWRGGRRGLSRTVSTDGSGGRAAALSRSRGSETPLLRNDRPPNRRPNGSRARHRHCSETAPNVTRSVEAKGGARLGHTCRGAFLSLIASYRLSYRSVSIILSVILSLLFSTYPPYLRTFSGLGYDEPDALFFPSPAQAPDSSFVVSIPSERKKDIALQAQSRHVPTVARPDPLPLPLPPARAAPTQAPPRLPALRPPPAPPRQLPLPSVDRPRPRPRPDRADARLPPRPAPVRLPPPALQPGHGHGPGGARASHREARRHRSAGRVRRRGEMRRRHGLQNTKKGIWSVGRALRGL